MRNHKGWGGPRMDVCALSAIELRAAMQVLGGRCADDRVLAAAQAIESVFGFDAHPPDQGGRT